MTRTDQIHLLLQTSEDATALEDAEEVLKRRGSDPEIIEAVHLEYTKACISFKYYFKSLLDE